MERKPAGRSGRRAVGLYVATVVALVISGCGDNGTGPGASLVGSWDIVGFSDMGIGAAATGTWVFRADGTFAANGTVMFPGEPVDAFLLSGLYVRSGTTLTLTVDGVASDWQVAESGNRVTLTEDEPAPANAIVLERSS